MGSVAASRGHVKIVELLLKSKAHRADCSLALRTAAKHGKRAIVQLLLRNGIVATYQDENGNTALHIACGHRHAEVVEALCDIGVINWNLKNRNGKSALDIAHEIGGPYIVAIVGFYKMMGCIPNQSLEDQDDFASNLMYTVRAAAF